MAENILISPIKEMELRSSKIPGVVSLAQGVPSFDTPLCIKKKAIEMMHNGRSARYSLAPGILELREAIEYDLAKQNIFYDFDSEIIVTAGSIEAITATFLALLEPGDEVLIPDPTYTSYQSAIKTARGRPVFVELDEEKGWAFDIDQFRKKITPKTKAILFCNPNNPSGTVYCKEDLMQLAQLAEQHNLYVLSDEVYRDFIYSQDEHYSIAQLSSFRKKLIYIFSFSKAYAMTGWRVAYLATDAQLAEKILGVHDALVTCAPVISQWGALAALEMADDDVAKFKKAFEKRRELMCGKLEKMDDYLTYIKPNSAYFVFPKIKPEIGQKIIQGLNNHQFQVKPYQESSVSWQFALKLLYEHRMAVVPGVAFGPSGEGHFRLCFGRQEDDIKEGMDRLHNFLKKL